tara:strand:+ start:618 stop:863 length:246 start_codon:yes stop_codon:yes gene_type:complete
LKERWIDTLLRTEHAIGQHINQAKQTVSIVCDDGIPSLAPKINDVASCAKASDCHSEFHQVTCWLRVKRAVLSDEKFSECR